MSSTSDTQPTGRNPVSVLHLVMGLVFLGGGAAWALRQAGVLDPTGADWVAPLVLLVAGGAGLLASVVRSRRRVPDDDSW